jgi:hypothetical protein
VTLLARARARTRHRCGVPRFQGGRRRHHRVRDPQRRKRPVPHRALPVKLASWSGVTVRAMRDGQVRRWLSDYHELSKRALKDAVVEEVALKSMRSKRSRRSSPADRARQLGKADYRSMNEELTRIVFDTLAPRPPETLDVAAMLATQDDDEVPSTIVRQPTVRAQSIWPHQLLGAASPQTGPVRQVSPPCETVQQAHIPALHSQ